MPRITPSKLDTDALASRLSTRESLNCTRAYTHKTSNVTTTSTVDLLSLTHSSKTGRVLVFGVAPVKTSSRTSNLSVYVGSTQIGDNSPTRLADYVNLAVMEVASVTKGAALTYYLKMSSQSASDTATCEAYTAIRLMVVDI